MQTPDVRPLAANPSGNAEPNPIFKLFAADCLVPSIGETPELYAAFRESFYQTAPPSNPFEQILLEDFISCQWRLLRARRAEAGLLDCSCVKTFAKSQVTGPDSVPFSPSYSDWTEEKRGATRLIGSAMSKRRTRAALGNLSQYEARLRRASLQALARLRTEFGENEPIEAAQTQESKG